MCMFSSGWCILCDTLRKMQTIAVAAAATGMSQADQAKLFRFTLKHSILLASIVGCLALLFSYALHLK